MNQTCYERSSTLIRTGENLAIKNNFSDNVNWVEIHWNWKARRIIECAYHLTCMDNPKDNFDDLPLEDAKRLKQVREDRIAPIRAAFKARLDQYCKEWGI